MHQRGVDTYHLRNVGRVNFPPLRSDRLGGPVPPVHEQLQASTSSGLLALVQSRIDANWVASEFPEICTDGGRSYICSTDQGMLRAAVDAGNQQLGELFDVSTGMGVVTVGGVDRQRARSSFQNVPEVACRVIQISFPMLHELQIGPVTSTEAVLGELENVGAGHGR